MKRLKVAVVMGGQSSEHDISMASGRAVHQALDEKRFAKRAVVITPDGRWCLHAEDETLPDDDGVYRQPLFADEAAGRLREWGSEVAFLALHGENGEDGAIQGFFHTLGMAHTASGVYAAALAMDKPRCKAYLGALGILTPASRVLRKNRCELPGGTEAFAALVERELDVPVFVKATRQGSSVGVHFSRSHDELVADLEALFVDQREILAERFIEGREVSCAVLGNAGDRLQALPPVEISPLANRPFFDFEAKYEPGAALETCPAPIGEALNRDVQDLACRIHQSIDARGFSRSDFILNDEGIWFLEINTIPGLTPQSIFPQAALQQGISFPQLVEKIIGYALR